MASYFNSCEVLLDLELSEASRKAVYIEFRNNKGFQKRSQDSCKHFRSKF